MVVKTKGAIQKIQSHLAKSGYQGVVTIGEPQNPPDGWSASISLVNYGPEPGQETTLKKTIEHRSVSISVRRAVLAGNPEDTEMHLDEIMTELHAALAGNFTLDGSIRNIKAITTAFLYEQIPTNGPEYRVGRMTVDFIVDDSGTHAA